MNKKELEKYFVILEVDADASFSEVEKAYNHLKELYSGDSVVMKPLEFELKQDKKQAILKDITKAYNILADHFNKSVKIEVEETTQEEAISVIELPLEEPDTSVITGEVLGEIWRYKGIKIEEIADITKISIQTLENIEFERYGLLPPNGYLRWHLTTIAKHLDLDPAQVAEDYMKRYREWKRGEKIL